MPKHSALELCLQGLLPPHGQRYFLVGLRVRVTLRVNMTQRPPCWHGDDTQGFVVKVQM